MPGDLDDILLSTDCPKCGAVVRFKWKQARIHKAAGCKCGAVIAIEDKTPLAAVQRLIDEASPPVADNDG